MYPSSARSHRRNNGPLHPWQRRFSEITQPRESLDCCCNNRRFCFEHSHSLTICHNLAQRAIASVLKTPTGPPNEKCIVTDPSLSVQGPFCLLGPALAFENLDQLQDPDPGSGCFGRAHKSKRYGTCGSHSRLPKCLGFRWIKSLRVLLLGLDQGPVARRRTFGGH